MTSLPAGWRRRVNKAQDVATVAGFRLAWRLVRGLPEPAAYAVFDRLADFSYRRSGPSVRRMRSNYSLVRPELNSEELDALTRAGMRSYLRYWCDAFRLPSLTRADLQELVVTSGAIDEVRAALSRGESIVLFLGHLGNWDLAGAWSATELAHVTTVAERLKPEELFEEFLGFREELGMTIIPLTPGTPVLERVADKLREPRGFAPLLSDRDLTSRGTTVDLAGLEARVAVGPAALARRLGVHLYPVSITYRERQARAMRGIDIHFHPEVQVEKTFDERADIQAATQACADALSSTLRTRTEDWHMMQRVFVQDVTARKRS